MRTINFNEEDIKQCKLALAKQNLTSLQSAFLMQYITNIEQENKQLKDNWNKLREWIVYNKHNENTEQYYLVVDYGTLLGKMQELEGSDSNDSN